MYIQLYESFEEDYYSKYSKISKLDLSTIEKNNLIKNLFSEFSNEIKDLIPDIAFSIKTEMSIIHFADKFAIRSIVINKENLNLDYIYVIVSDLNRLYSIMSYKYDILISLNIKNDNNIGVFLTECTLVNKVSKIKAELLDLILNKSIKDHYVYTGKYNLEYIQITFFKKNDHHNKITLNYINQK